MSSGLYLADPLARPQEDKSRCAADTLPIIRINAGRGPAAIRGPTDHCPSRRPSAPCTPPGKINGTASGRADSHYYARTHRRQDAGMAVWRFLRPCVANVVGTEFRLAHTDR